MFWRFGLRGLHIYHLSPPDLLTDFIPKILKKWYESKQFQWERLFPREDSHQYSRDWILVSREYWSQQMYPKVRACNKPRSVYKPRSAWQRLKFTAGRLEQENQQFLAARQHSALVFAQSSARGPARHLPASSHTWNSLKCSAISFVSSDLSESIYKPICCRLLRTEHTGDG